MAFYWSNIENKEKASSVREKINELGVAYSSTSSDVETLQTDSYNISNSLTKLNKMVSISTNVSCPLANWQTDSDKTYINYPYKIDISVSGVTASMVPIVNLDIEQQESGNFCGAQTSAGIVTIWAKLLPEADFTIPNIVFLTMVTL